MTTIEKIKEVMKHYECSLFGLGDFIDENRALIDEYCLKQYGERSDTLLYVDNRELNKKLREWLEEVHDKSIWSED